MSIYKRRLWRLSVIAEYGRENRFGSVLLLHFITHLTYQFWMSVNEKCKKKSAVNENVTHAHNAKVQ